MNFQFRRSTEDLDVHVMDPGNAFDYSTRMQLRSTSREHTNRLEGDNVTLAQPISFALRIEGADENIAREQIDETVGFLENTWHIRRLTDQGRRSYYRSLIRPSCLQVAEAAALNAQRTLWRLDLTLLPQHGRWTRTQTNFLDDYLAEQISGVTGSPPANQNYRFLPESGEVGAVPVHVVSSQRMNRVEKDMGILQPPGSEMAFATGLSLDRVTDFEITCLLEGQGDTPIDRNNDAMDQVEMLTEAAETSFYLQRHVPGGTENAYRALWGDKRTLAGRRLQFLNPVGTDILLTLVLRPKFARWTLAAAAESFEYNTGFTTLSIAAAAGASTATFRSFTTEFSDEFA